MRIRANTKNKPCTIQIKIVCFEPKKMYIKVKDPEVPDTVYTDRYCIIERGQTFYVRMPISPKKADIIIKSESELAGELNDKMYKVGGLKILPLKRKLTAFNNENKAVNDYINFCQEFCAKAGYISAGGSIYMSNDGKFRIDYLDDITDGVKSLNTPARISKSQGIIEVSKSKFKEYTVPMRMCILLHEFSHFYLNTDMANETEADLNGLIIYLGLGYPRIDAYNVFTQVFVTSANPTNANRMKIIDRFIRNFEKTHPEMSYENKNFKN